MAGNVKEWVLNSTGSKRYILGGAWNEPVYMFTNWDVQSPFTRHPNSGIRCIKVDRPEDLSSALTAIIHTPSRDVRNIKPVSSQVFKAWRSLYSFDHGDLKVQMEFVDDTSPDWRMEKISYAIYKIDAVLLVSRHHAHALDPDRQQHEPEPNKADHDQHDNSHRRALWPPSD